MLYYDAREYHYARQIEHVIPDILLALAWGGVIVVFLYALAKQRYKKEPFFAKMFLYGLLIRIFGAIAMGLVYNFYYGGGDSLNYFGLSLIFKKFLWDYPSYAPVLLTQPAYVLERLAQEDMLLSQWLLLAKHVISYRFWSSDAAVATAQQAALCSFFAPYSYYSANVMSAIYTYAGVWAIYRTFAKLYPQLKIFFSYTILFLPTQWFWGSGVMKDAYTINMLGWIIYGLFNFAFFYKSKNLLKFFISLLIIFIGAYWIYRIRAYVLLGFLPFGGLWLLTGFVKGIPNALLRFFMTPLLTIAILLSSWYALNQLSKGIYSIENIVEHAVVSYIDRTSAMYFQRGAGSAYDLGEIEPTVWGLLSKFPIAVVTTFFRPFPWEIRSAIMIPESILAVIVTILVARILMRINLFNFIYYWLKNPDALLALGFALFFGFFAGIGAGNFGSLSRYKLPAILFFFIGLGIIYYDGYLRYHRRPVMGRIFA